jgi:hypothetical protein
MLRRCWFCRGYIRYVAKADEQSHTSYGGGGSFRYNRRGLEDRSNRPCCNLPRALEKGIPHGEVVGRGAGDMVHGSWVHREHVLFVYLHSCRLQHTLGHEKSYCICSQR